MYVNPVDSEWKSVIKKTSTLRMHLEKVCFLVDRKMRFDHRQIRDAKG